MVRIETSPEDLAGMAVAEGILTARGGMTSHAAVVARGMGKCCVSGASLEIDYKNKTVEVDGIKLKEGDYISNKRYDRYGLCRKGRDEGCRTVR